jgi:hypothetical protein
LDILALLEECIERASKLGDAELVKNLRAIAAEIRAH